MKAKYKQVSNAVLQHLRSKALLFGARFPWRKQVEVRIFKRTPFRHIQQTYSSYVEKRQSSSEVAMNRRKIFLKNIFHKDA